MTAGGPRASRVAVVTGAAGGIGSAICRRLAADGFLVAGVDLRADDLPADIADADSYLASDAAGYMQGAVMMVDGGVTA